ncbi:uncharacterized protein LOC100908914 [Galendromus occidentalis]|uniref:Uncharacterized protein LOC100908914 n=1 Tax=Galendromus occidentalis TaxID=34638 RepID=A0AAJ6QPZ4_9ACAR|nr:uncharacterized protein LOC100908914 [Galendromus occidentalis]
MSISSSSTREEDTLSVVSSIRHDNLAQVLENLPKQLTKESLLRLHRACLECDTKYLPQSVEVADMLLSVLLDKQTPAAEQQLALTVLQHFISQQQLECVLPSLSIPQIELLLPLLFVAIKDFSAVDSRLLDALKDPKVNSITKRSILCFYTQLAQISPDRVSPQAKDTIIGIIPLWLNDPSLKNFTASNQVRSHTSDQFLNVATFSLLPVWLGVSHSENHPKKSALFEATMEYSAAVVELAMQINATENATVLCQAVQCLNELCTYDESQQSWAIKVVNKIKSVDFLLCLQVESFCCKFSQDPQRSVALANVSVSSIISAALSNTSNAHTVVEFLRSNLQNIARHVQYNFPGYLKIFARFPKHIDLTEVLAASITEENFEHVFRKLLLCPAVTAALIAPHDKLRQDVVDAIKPTLDMLLGETFSSDARGDLYLERMVSSLASMKHYRRVALAASTVANSLLHTYFETLESKYPQRYFELLSRLLCKFPKRLVLPVEGYLEEIQHMIIELFCENVSFIPNVAETLRQSEHAAVVIVKLLGDAEEDTCEDYLSVLMEHLQKYSRGSRIIRVVNAAALVAQKVSPEQRSLLLETLSQMNIKPSEAELNERINQVSAEIQQNETLIYTNSVLFNIIDNLYRS